jgi:hypothetical protein
VRGAEVTEMSVMRACGSGRSIGGSVGRRQSEAGFLWALRRAGAFFNALAGIVCKSLQTCASLLRPRAGQVFLTRAI